MRKTKFKGAIFDFNGTLFFDSDKQEKAWKRFSTDVRGQPFTNDEMIKHVHGRTNRSILEFLLNREIPDDVLKYFVAKKEDFYRFMCLQDKKNLKLVDGAEALFDHLYKNKTRMTIATSSEITNLQFFIKQFKLNRWFNTDNLIFDDYKIKGKPAPDMYVAAAQKLNLSPAECIVFEASESGIQSATAAGIGKIIIIDPKAEKSNFIHHPNVDLIVKDFSKIDANDYF